MMKSSSSRSSSRISVSSNGIGASAQSRLLGVKRHCIINPCHSTRKLKPISIGRNVKRYVMKSALVVELRIPMFLLCVCGGGRSRITLFCEIATIYKWRYLCKCICVYGNVKYKFNWQCFPRKWRLGAYWKQSALGVHAEWVSGIPVPHFEKFNFLYCDAHSHVGVVKD